MHACCPVAPFIHSVWALPLRKKSPDIVVTIIVRQACFFLLSVYEIAFITVI